MIEKSASQPSQISLYKDGKINLSPDQLWELISSLDRIDPKTRLNIGLKIGGCYSEEKEIDWDKIIKSISKKDVRKILWAIGNLIDSPKT